MAVPCGDSNGFRHQYFPKMYQFAVVFMWFTTLSSVVREYEVGVDEAGRGPAIGPLVVCAISLPRTDRDVLANLGVDDSKRLSKKRREEIYGRIKHYSESRGWGIGLDICEPIEIDDWMDSGTLNSLEVMMFAKAIKLASEPSDVCSLFVDACDINAERFGRRITSILGSTWERCKMKSKHKMDSSDVIVGAASIIAKVTRDKEMEKLSELIGFELGSGYPSDPITKSAIEILCASTEPHPSLRWKWKNVQRSWTSQNGGPMPNRSSDSGTSSQSTLGDWK